MAAFKRENIALNGAHRITVVYEANSTLLEEFGDFFGFDGARYHAENGVVIGKTDTTHPLSITPYFITVSFNNFITHRMIMAFSPSIIFRHYTVLRHNTMAFNEN